jgi:hypothetical protein
MSVMTLTRPSWPWGFAARQATGGNGSCVEVAALFVSEVGSARCYGLPDAFNDMTRSFLLYPEGSAVVGLRLYSDYNCAGLAKTIRQYYAPSVLPTFPLDALSSCTYMTGWWPPPSR